MCIFLPLLCKFNSVLMKRKTKSQQSSVTCPSEIAGKRGAVFLIPGLLIPNLVIFPSLYHLAVYLFMKWLSKLLEGK